MGRLAECYLACAMLGLCAAAPWKLVLKDGTAVMCDAAPIAINDVYMCRDTDGKEVSLPADQVDREKTDKANKVTPGPRQWRMIGQSVYEPAAGGITAVRDADFDAAVLESTTPVLVEFGATWCGYCKKLEPTLESIAAQYAGRLKVFSLDIDQNRATSRRYGIYALPTLMLFTRGQAAATIRGAADKSTVTRILDHL